MSPEQLSIYLAQGEGSTVEFKRCGNQPERDVFETICSFSNHSGGNVFLGVKDDGTVVGVPAHASLDIKRNIINIVNNPNVFSPAVTLEFEEIVYDSRTVVRIWVPVSPAVHVFKSQIYDRAEDVDVRLKVESQIAMLYLRKQNLYAEQRIYRYVEPGDFELERLETLRVMAGNKRANHPWLSMSDDDLFRSAKLYGKDYSTGEQGFNLASILLLGRPEVIASVCPTYKTDAILRRDNLDRYDDRLVVSNNLVDAYPSLVEFCQKHLPDRFYLEGEKAISPRDIIIREIVSNTLIHREYSSPFPAKLIIDKESLYTENASKAMFEGSLDLSHFNPMPKNPIIARFFNNIGWADELGSGTRNLFKYAKEYAGSSPLLVEGSVFKAHVPLMPTRADRDGLPVAERVLAFVEECIASQGYVTTVDVRDGLHVGHKTAQRELSSLVVQGLLRAEGNTRARRYYLGDVV